MQTIQAILSFLVVFVSAVRTQSNSEVVVTRLIEPEIYDSRLAPPSSGAPLDVKVSMYISAACWKSEKMHIRAFMRHYWTDSRLSIPKGRNVTLNHRAIDDIWTPDTFFINAKVETLYKGGVVIDSSNGNITYSKRIAIKSYCPTTYEELTRGRGKINCTVHIEPYMHQPDSMVLSWKNNVKLGSGSMISKVTSRKSTSRIGDHSYDRLSFTVQLYTGITPQVANYMFKQSLASYTY